MRFRRRHFEKHQCQHREHQGLDESDKQFQKQKRQWEQKGRNRHHGSEQNFTSKNISKKPRTMLR